MTLGGFLCIRRGFELDYCFEAAIRSLLPICEQVVVSESESDDGTRAALDHWAASEPKLKIVDYPWTDPKGDAAWWPTWLNSARGHLATDWSIYLDADEVLHESSYPHIRQCVDTNTVAMAYRLNFWRDARHLIPKGQCCGFEVIRLGPQPLFFPSDYSDPLGRSAPIEARAIRVPEIRIFHYGFLRRREAFFAKARVVQQIWAGDGQYDPRLKAAESYDGNWMDDPAVVGGWNQRLDDFTGTHPACAHDWLRARGYSDVADVPSVPSINHQTIQPPPNP